MVQDDILQELIKQNRRLKYLLGATGLLAGGLLLSAAKSEAPKASFSEIDVERINIVAPDGQKEMVLSNRTRLPDPIVDGKSGKRSGPPRPGIIFYNAVGDENGGLIYDGKLDANGKPSAGMHFSMDRFGGDQQLALGHYESGGTMESGLTLFDRGLHKDYADLWEAYEKAPKGPEKDALLKRWEEAGGRQVKRLFVGKSRDQSPAVILADQRGRPRIMMLLDKQGEPMLSFLDENGKTIQNLPDVKR